MRTEREIIVIALDNEPVEKAFKRQFSCRNYKIYKVIAKRDTKGNGVWKVMK